MAEVKSHAEMDLSKLSRDSSNSTISPMKLEDYTLGPHFVEVLGEPKATDTKKTAK